MELNAPVSGIMTTKVHSVTPDQTLADVKHLFEKSPFHHHVPVVEKDKLVGMISLVDFMRAIGNATLDDKEPVYQLKAKAIMTTKPVAVKREVPIKKVAQQLAKGDIHALAVTENDKLVGMVSYSDVISYLLKVLN